MWSKRKTWRENTKYRRGKIFGIHNILFTLQQEHQVAELLKMQYIDVGISVKRRHLKHILWEFYKSFDPEIREFLDRQRVSCKFVKAFCQRNNPPFRVIRSKKREKIDATRVAIYIHEFRNCMLKNCRAKIYKAFGHSCSSI